MAFWHFELEAIARQSIEASRKVICAYFGNIGRNSGYFLHQIFLAVHPNGYINALAQVPPPLGEREGAALAVGQGGQAAGQTSAIAPDCSTTPRPNQAEGWS